MLGYLFSRVVACLGCRRPPCRPLWSDLFFIAACERRPWFVTSASSYVLIKYKEDISAGWQQKRVLHHSCLEEMMKTQHVLLHFLEGLPMQRNFRLVCRVYARLHSAPDQSDAVEMTVSPINTEGWQTVFTLQVRSDLFPKSVFSFWLFTFFKT